MKLLSRGARYLRSAMAGGVKLGEIKNDELYALLREVAARPDIKTILEIGASTGDGSTEAFVKGMAANPSNPRLYCVEVLADRFAVLQRRYAGNPAVKCYNVSAVTEAAYPTDADVRAFLRTTRTNLREQPDTILRWLQGEREYLRANQVPPDGIEQIKRENGLAGFDAALLDGSEFTGSAELDRVIGARVILLDDINAYKHHYSCQRLLRDPRYRLLAANLDLRNGYAAFELVA